MGKTYEIADMQGMSVLSLTQQLEGFVVVEDVRNQIRVCEDDGCEEFKEGRVSYLVGETMSFLHELCDVQDRVVYNLELVAVVLVWDDFHSLDIIDICEQKDGVYAGSIQVDVMMPVVSENLKLVVYTSIIPVDRRAMQVNKLAITNNVSSLTIMDTPPDPDYLLVLIACLLGTLVVFLIIGKTICYYIKKRIKDRKTAKSTNSQGKTTEQTENKF